MNNRCWGRIFAAWILLLLVSPAAANSKFSIEGSRLLLDGTAFAVRGVVYSNAAVGRTWADSLEASECLYARDFPLVTGLGANTVRTLAMVPPGSRAFSQSLASNHLYWLAGFPLDRFYNSAGSLSSDAAQGTVLRAEILTEFRAFVEAWKDEPRLLAFVFGNEVDVDYARKFGGGLADFFTLLREAAAVVNESAPGTLVTTSVGDPKHIGAFNLGTNDPSQPDVSFWSVHVDGAAALDPAIQETRTRTAKPLLVSAFAADAYDPATQSEAPQRQAERARDLAHELTLATGNPSFRVLGGVWGALLDEWWRGGPDASRHGAGAVPVAGAAATETAGAFHPAWAGLFGVSRGAIEGLDNLRPREAYFALAEEWGGSPRAELGVEDLPRIATGGLTNTASGFESVAPGSLFTIRGENFTGGLNFGAASGDLPYQLGGVSACVDGQPAPLYFAAHDEIRAQAPWEISAGVRKAIVYRGGIASQPASADVLADAPGIFEGAVFRPGLPCPVDGENGVRPGDFLEVYGTGFGPPAGVVSTGRAGAESIELAAQPQASLDSQEIDVVYAGLLGGAVGVYQANVRIPRDITPRVASLRLRQEARMSNAVAIQVAAEADPRRLFLHAPQPGMLMVQAGGPPAKALLRIAGNNGFCGLVRFEIGGLPAGVRASIPVGVPGQTVPIEIRADAAAPRADNAPVTITARSSLADAPRQTLGVTVLPALGDIRFRVVSGGWLSGSPAASFAVDGRLIYESSGGGPGRGFNFITVDPQTGVLSAVQTFDTWGDEGAVRSMEAFLKSLPPGQVVLAAVADDGALLLSAETRRLFRDKLGAQWIESLAYQSSWALISRVGAPQPIAEGLMPDEQVVIERTLTFPMP